MKDQKTPEEILKGIIIQYNSQVPDRDMFRFSQKELELFKNAMQEYAQTISEPLKKLLKHHADMLAESDTQNLKYAQKIVNLEAISEGKDREIEEKDKLIKKQEEYIKFLGDNIGQFASYLEAHNLRPTREDVEIGKRLRAEIAALKSVH